jgi:hypothetical protein
VIRRSGSIATGSLVLGSGGSKGLVRGHRAGQKDRKGHPSSATQETWVAPFISITFAARASTPHGSRVGDARPAGIGFVLLASFPKTVCKFLHASALCHPKIGFDLALSRHCGSSAENSPLHLPLVTAHYSLATRHYPFPLPTAHRALSFQNRLRSPARFQNETTLSRYPEKPLNAEWNWLRFGTFPPLRLFHRELTSSLATRHHPLPSRRHRPLHGNCPLPTPQTPHATGRPALHAPRPTPKPPARPTLHAPRYLLPHQRGKVVRSPSPAGSCLSTDSELTRNERGLIWPIRPSIPLFTERGDS